MSGHVIQFDINGHVVEYSRETNGRYICRNCGTKLLSTMQFQTRECPEATR